MTTRRTQWAALGRLALGLSTRLAPGQIPHTLSLKATEAFDTGMGGNVVPAYADSGGVVLFDRVLVEDDGPGIDSDSRWLNESLKSPNTVIDGPVKIRKESAPCGPAARGGRYSSCGASCWVSSGARPAPGRPVGHFR